MNSEYLVLPNCEYLAGECCYSVLAKDQPQYLQLSIVKSNNPSGRITSRWKLSWRERFRMFLFGEFWVQMLTFHSPPMPIKFLTTEPTPEECL